MDLERRVPIIWHWQMQTASSYIMLENDMQGLVVQDANMDMQARNVGRCQCLLPPGGQIVHQWQVHVATDQDLLLLHTTLTKTGGIAP
jgi:hypothetical protein